MQSHLLLNVFSLKISLFPKIGLQLITNFHDLSFSLEWLKRFHFQEMKE